MTAEKSPLSDATGGGWKCFIEQSDASQCKTANRPYLKATDNEAQIVYFIRPDCKTWGCEWCAEQRRKHWTFLATFGGDFLLRSGSELSFVTLTSHRKIRHLPSAIKVWRKAWPKLSARWRRATPGVQYLYIAEHRKRVHFHVHIITTATLPTRWYKDNAAETGLGYQAEAVRIGLAIECGGYVGKYLGKAIHVMGWPKYWRRVNTSRAWPKPELEEDPRDWLCLGPQTSRVRGSAMAYKRAGWRVETSLNALL
ncbi:hypothetical protein LCGC14_2098950 [marine sediment metagenome]|uniref:Replication-associated protein ORF2/G2P domain-containing protein n=1 Tax=marine sediment metagenome TaxID=412755 RepID=A0A0F9EAE9_9ZZZZ